MPAQTHQDTVLTIGKWQFLITSCENQHVSDPPIMVTTDQNIKKVYNLVFQDRRIYIGQIFEDTGLSYYGVIFL